NRAEGPASEQGRSVPSPGVVERTVNPSFPESPSWPVPVSPPSTLEALAARLVEVMADAWHRGERPRAEEYLAQHPELFTTPQTAAQLIYAEICLREEAGQ